MRSFYAHGHPDEICQQKLTGARRAGVPDYDYNRGRERSFMRKKLSTYIWEYKWHYLFAIVSLLISVSLDMLAPMLTMHIIDDVILGGNLTTLPYLLGGILIVGVGRCIFQYTKEYTFDKVGSSIASDMRKNLFDHIQSLSSSFFDKTNTGELMARVKDDIDRIWNTLSYVSMLIIEVIFHTCVVLFCMYRLHAPLAVDHRYDLVRLDRCRHGASFRLHL